jgi:hypothetical protein
MKTTVKLTVPEMVGFLKTIGTASMFISMDTVTTIKRGKGLKVGCPFGDVTKLAVRTGWLNIKYNDAVKRRIAAKLGVQPSEVEYENGETWHTALMTEDNPPKATPVRVNKAKDDGKFYVFYFHRKTKEARYVAANGDTISYEQLKPYFYAKGEQPDFKPAVRCVTLNNVRMLKARGMIVKGAH